jgi:two-component system response regulator AtoC
MESCRIFIVEDDPWYGEILKYHLSMNPENEVYLFTTGKECLANIHKKPTVISVDYSLPDMNGADLLKRIRQINKDIPVIIISAQADVSTAVELLKSGVYDYIVKNDHAKDLLWNAVIRVKENQALKNEIEHLRTELGHKYNFETIIKGKSPAIKKVFALMEKAARTNINVSITGETGTGKELVAKAIHYNSERQKKPFVAVNMAAVPRELIESEFFGFEKGAFTGADSRKTGKFEEANGGTIFLDEIGELDLSVQSKLLRVLQERELTRIGGKEKIKLDVRVIVATHKNLADEVEKGSFREDLYYRIIGLPIELPPLRDRETDILLLARFFLEEFSRDNRMKITGFTAAAKTKLMQYHYPGNVRELKAIIDLAAVMCSGSEVDAADITFTKARSPELMMTDEKTFREYTVQIIQYYLKKYNGNVLTVAKKLDLGKSTIYKMIQEKEVSV